MKKIDIEKIRNCTPALTKSWSEQRLEAALFCLDHNSHKTGVECLDTSQSLKYELRWHTEISEAMKRTHNDVQDATEMGAEGMAALFADELTPYQIIIRSAKRTGIDYWLGDKQRKILLYQKSARLEVSGLINGSDAEFARRIKKKKEQTMQSRSSKLPAYVAITDFGKPRIAFEKV
ncbi:hypothetical protein GGR26_002856 [Lewinella marina]|uniref:Uncharacterized protein n=1 Tax=Neolewinella marina TaxID=438751 RepID=A0A2G0CBM6_9BACT|nr:hypothetical protein [Neolewinella marina]NJB87079.1 hypothetical protein [Neolewinella marina]PHK97388.1 hypothetical protein CGL56_16425 [Neolewinella marina]